MSTADVLSLLTAHEADVCAINETWLSPDVHNYEVLPRDYVVLRKDRLGGRRPAGGVALAIRPHLQPKRLQQLEGQAEIVWAQIKANSLHFLVGSAYRRPNADTVYNAALLESLELAAAEQHSYDGCFLMGDFNLSVSWLLDPPRAHAAPADDFLSAFTTMALEQHIKSPTRTTENSENILDLFLSDVPELVAAANVVCRISDHDALLVTLSQIKASAAAGPDGLPAPLLKYCAAALAPSPAHVFNKSLESAELPADWKTAAVTPIFKDGDKSNMQNYRPISITSLVGKTLERIVRDRTVEYLEKEKVIPSCQHGFREKRSCTTLLTGTIDHWTAALDEASGTHIHAVFLDWSKAFDKVLHPRLLSKLQHYGIKGQMLKWYENFLVGRTQFVKFGGESSEPCEVASGVVQGSVLGPLLFNIFVADLPEMVTSSTLVQYADDATIYKEIRCQEDADALQEDLFNIDIWCSNNGMTLNAKKCKIMDITRARVPLQFVYTLGATVLEYVHKERMLGVHISSDLRWHEHTDIVRGKAARNLRFAARNLQGCTARVKRVAYLTLVRPVMTFGLPAWHPTTQDNVNRLERVQKRAVHFIYGRNPPPANEQKIMPFPMLLRYNDFIFFKKCECGETDFNARARIIEGRVLRGDSGQHPRLQPPPTSSVFGQRAFSFRVVKPWNDLPLALKDCNAAQFPALLKQHMWQEF
ncbi:uncharacterized protein LOC135937619 [Cloeon dipterum]|uniref:uncharacterized protein LOC135937619 n=1 Tax=Cloeon dipterum TaxID=197152 RepID=UPI00321F7B28